MYRSSARYGYGFHPRQAHRSTLQYPPGSLSAERSPRYAGAPKPRACRRSVRRLCHNNPRYAYAARSPDLYRAAPERFLPSAPPIRRTVRFPAHSSCSYADGLLLPRGHRSAPFHSSHPNGYALRILPVRIPDSGCNSRSHACALRSRAGRRAARRARWCSSGWCAYGSRNRRSIPWCADALSAPEACRSASLPRYSTAHHAYVP